MEINVSSELMYFVGFFGAIGTTLGLTIGAIGAGIACSDEHVKIHWSRVFLACFAVVSTVGVLVGVFVYLGTRMRELGIW